MCSNKILFAFFYLKWYTKYHIVKLSFFLYLGGGIKNVFNTLMEGGRSGKGMISWKDQLKPTEMQKVASYVLSLQGTNPKDPKPTEPEAVLYKAEGAAATDEAKTETVVDSTGTN